MEAYWINVFSQPVTTKPQCVRRSTIDDVWQPIIPENITAAMPFLSVTPSSDGVTGHQLSHITRLPHKNMESYPMVWEATRPSRNLMNSLHPKETGSQAAWRLSTNLRFLCTHQICKQSLSIGKSGLSHSARREQWAFRGGIDGCRDNTVLLDALIRSQYTSSCSLYIATLDAVNIFDRVDHTALQAPVKAAGHPPTIILYYYQDYY